LGSNDRLIRWDKRTTKMVEWAVGRPETIRDDDVEGVL
jgi:hypothetical protein